MDLLQFRCAQTRCLIAGLGEEIANPMKLGFLQLKKTNTKTKTSFQVFSCSLVFSSSSQEVSGHGGGRWHGYHCDGGVGGRGEV
jgi:hypothetical protein